MFRVYILCHEQGIVTSDAIGQRITNRTRDWKKGLMPELVQYVVLTVRHGKGGNRATNDKSIARTFHSMVAQDKLRSTVSVAASRDGGGVYAPEDTDTKLGQRLIDVLQDKHPKMMDSDIEVESWMSFKD